MTCAHSIVVGPDEVFALRCDLVFFDAIYDACVFDPWDVMRSSKLIGLEVSFEVDSVYRGVGL